VDGSRIAAPSVDLVADLACWAVRSDGQALAVRDEGSLGDVGRLTSSEC